MTGYRIVEKEDGFIVEHGITYKSLLGMKTKYVPFIYYMGLPLKAYPHKTYESAMENLLIEVKKRTTFIKKKGNE